MHQRSRGARGAAPAGGGRAGRAARCGLGLSLLLCAWDGAVAAEWYVEPSVRVRELYDTNIRLSDVRDDESWVSIVNVLAELGVRTATSGVSVTPRLRFARYASDEDLDTDDQFVDFAAYANTERDEVRLDGSFIRDATTTRTEDEVDSELLSSGQVQRRVRRERLELTPSWTRRVSERVTAGVSASYLDASYDAPTASGLLDYDYLVGKATVGYRLSEVDQVSGVVSASRFEVSQAANETDSVGLTLRYDRQFSDTLKGHAAVGVLHSDLQFEEAGTRRETTENGLLGEVGVSGRLERGEWGVLLSRTVNPTSGGLVVERDEVSMTLDHDFSRTLRGGVELVAFEDGALSDEASFSDREFLRLATRLQWRIERGWTLVGGYRYTRQDRDTFRSAADSHALFVTLSYRAPRIAISR